MSENPPSSANRGTRPRRGLGRGLDVLLPAAESGVREVDIDSIEPNPNQPRQRFVAPAIEELARSISQHGIVQPLVVQVVDGGRYRIIVGERRWQAARRAGLQQVPVVVKEASDRQTLELALIENVQRADLNPLEEAAAYGRLIQDFGLTQAEVAQSVGKSRVAVTNTLRLLALPQSLKNAVLDGRITEGHARALLGLTDSATQMAALDRIMREGLTVRATEELVRRLQERPTPRPARRADPDVAALEQNLARALGTRVSLRPTKRGGRVVIEYYSDEEFEGLYRRLMEAE